MNDRYAVTYYNGFPGTSKNKLKTEFYNEGKTFKPSKCPTTKKGYRFDGWLYVTGKTVDSKGCYTYTFDKASALSGGDQDHKINTPES